MTQSKGVKLAQMALQALSLPSSLACFLPLLRTSIYTLARLILNLFQVPCFFTFRLLHMLPLSGAFCFLYLLTFSLSFKAELLVGTIPQALKPESGTSSLAEIIVV